MITSKPMEQVVTENFERYAGNVILDRAICDVRDMLKPSARMLMYSQEYISKNTHKKPFIKSARIVGDCLGHLYEHGDASCYGAYIRMAKPFAMRYPLEECQGSYGSITNNGDEASMRYTELRLSELASYVYGGLDKNAVGEEWRTNFDETERYPGVMPSIGYFNICNGTTGLGIAISSSIPQFNLKEVNEAIIKLMRDPNVSDNEILIMPDFATGAILTNADEVRESLRVGGGKSCRLRAKIEYNPRTNSLIVTEVPYGVYTGRIVKAIAELLAEDENYGIKNVNDNSGETAEIHIELDKGINPDKMIAKLYKDTPLESHYTINMWVLKDGRFPEQMGLRKIFNSYIQHIRECKRREISFDLDKALARENVIEGLLIAAANIDEVISIIRSSQDTSEASDKLIARFKFNIEQVKAILAIKLASLTKIDSIKLNNELAQIRIDISEYRHLLMNPPALDEKLIELLNLVSQKFGDARRTRITNVLGDEEEPEEIKEEDVIVLQNGSSIKVIKKDVNRGKRGKVQLELFTTNFGSLILFTSSGKMYTESLSKIKYDKDIKLTDIFPIGAEKPLLLIDTRTFNAFQSITCVTKHGFIKKSHVGEYLARAKKGTAAIKLEEGDSLVSVILSSDDDDKVAIISSSDYYNCFPLSDIAYTGRLTKGVKAIKLTEKEEVKEAKWVGDNTYKITGRAVKGVKNA